MPIDQLTLMGGKNSTQLPGSTRRRQALLLLLLAGSVIACTKPTPGEPPSGQAVRPTDRQPSQGQEKSAASDEAVPTKPEASAGEGQSPRATVAPAPATPTVVLDAVAGEPYGVGQMTVEFPPGTGPNWFPDQVMQIVQEGHRALYPALEVRYDWGEGAPKYRVQSFTCYFLFHGNEALHLTLAADRGYDASVRPIVDADRHRLLLARWWSRFRTTEKPYLGRYGAPELVHGYLKSMLQRRLGLSDEPAGGGLGLYLVPMAVMRSILRAVLPVDPFPPRGASPPPSTPEQPSVWEQLLRGKIDTDFGQFLGVLFGMESIRVALQADEMLSDSAAREIADQDMPPAIAPPPVAVPYGSPLADVEAIADHVPEECFYVRCGSVADYFWLRNLVTDWGGSIDHLISMRALDHGIRPRLERQLALSSDPKFRQDLDKCISDMALVGSDIFFREGAAIGVLWEASDSAALESLLRRQRKTVWENTPQAVEREMEAGGLRATLLATADNTVRSFYAIDGNYHFVTNSSYLVKRFFDAGRGKRSLGGLREFRYARTKMPLDREDAAFIYLSDPFFRLLVGPQYRVEMTRRMRALGDLQLVRMAQLAAKLEGVEASTSAELIRHGFLPSALLDRCDGSRPVLHEGRPIDSLRGAAGVFVPVPDVPVSKITAAEAASYRQFAEKYRSQWQRMDPVTVGIARRFDPERKRERVLLDVQITPYAREHYQALFQVLGRPDGRWRVPTDGDLLAIDARVGNLRRLWSAIPFGQGYLFGGVRDFSPAYAIRDGQVATVPLGVSGLLDAAYPAYLGLKTQGGPADPLSSLDRHVGPTDDLGYSQSRNAMLPLLEWRCIGQDGSVAWAHRKDILEAVLPATMEETEWPAQIRFRLGDVGESQFAAALQAICYVHARRISTTNTQLLAELTHQLGVPAAEARVAAEQLLGARLVCPLGGEYRLEPRGAAAPHWKSTGWPRESVYEETVVPLSYRFSFLQWLHGAEVYFTLTATALSVHAELEVATSAGTEPARPRFHRRAASRPKPHVVERPVIAQAQGLEPEPRPAKIDEPAVSSTANGQVFFDVDVPDGALVFVNGAPTRSKGTFRRYVSSGLAPALWHSYEFRVLMTREGKRVEQIQRVWLRAGETKHLVFMPQQATPVVTALGAGDVVLVAVDGTPLAVSDTLLARIPQGRRLTVLQTQGDWVWTSTGENGRRVEGWVPAENVILFARTVPR